MVQQGRFNKGPAHAATTYQRGTFADGITDQSQQTLRCGLTDHRAHVYAGVRRIPFFQDGTPGFDQRDQLICHGVHHDQALGRHADLSLVQIGTTQGGLCGGL